MTLGTIWWGVWPTHFLLHNLERAEPENIEATCEYNSTRITFTGLDCLQHHRLNGALDMRTTTRSWKVRSRDPCRVTYVMFLVKATVNRQPSSEISLRVVRVEPTGSVSSVRIISPNSQVMCSFCQDYYYRSSQMTLPARAMHFKSRKSAPWLHLVSRIYAIYTTKRFLCSMIWKLGVSDAIVCAWIMQDIFNRKRRALPHTGAAWWVTKHHATSITMIQGINWISYST